MEAKRSSFTGKIGFILAAAGSAVGLGNIWRFPYLAAKYGGGIFLLVYLILAVTFGFALMIAEISIGRKTGVSGIKAFGMLSKNWRFAGIFAAIVPMIILPYYSVIGGWVTKYFVTFVTGGMTNAADDAFFGTFISGVTEPLLWFALFLFLTAVVVFFGVEKGIEKASKVLMPVLVVLSLFIAVYSLFIDGALEGVKYYFVPDFSKFSSGTVLAAMGQLFYSMSLAMGIMITYGSYMPKETSIEKSVRHIEIFDTGIAFIAGLMIIPPIFAVGTPDMLEKAGPGLMFVSLPKLFTHMAGGRIIGAVFFVMVFFAALTSSISLMEAVISAFMDKFGWGRKTTCVVVALGSLVLGAPSSLGFGLWEGVKILGMNFLDFFDFSANSILMPIGAFITCIFVGYVIKPSSIIDEVKEAGNAFKAEKLFSIVIKYIAPVCIVLIFLTGLGIIKL
ncbi:MAG: sodium-dependent transporter [Clostridia bacterium]|nr:sodium-dependent transporter [Clostridia bacterium]